MEMVKCLHWLLIQIMALGNTTDCSLNALILLSYCFWFMPFYASAHILQHAIVALSTKSWQYHECQRAAISPAKKLSDSLRQIAAYSPFAIFNFFDLLT